MSAPKPKPAGVLGAIAGLFGFSALAGVLVTVMVTPAIAVTGMTANTSISIFENLPNFIELNRQVERNTIFAMQDGKPKKIATVYQQNRREVGWDEISDHAKNALTSGEDRRFYEHGGVDVAAVVRAAVGNTVSGGIQSGASTLTMQLVKNIFVQQALEEEDPDKRKQLYAEAIDPEGFDRKLREMRLAISLEKKYTKQEILLAYLNIAGFGGNTYGIQAAAERYYKTSAAKLTPAQAASLIAIVQYPGLRSLDDPEHYGPNQERRDQILGRMLQDKKITDKEFAEAIATPVDDTTVTLRNPKNGCRSAHEYARQWCDYIRKSIEDLDALGETPEERAANWARGGYEIYTSLDLKLNKVAQDSIWAHAPGSEERFNLGAASTTVEVGTGFILTMAQNKTFDDSLEAQGKRTRSAVNFNTDKDYGGSNGFQPGSTFKPFTLLAWLKAGKGLNELLNATPRSHMPSEFQHCDGPLGGPPWVLGNDGSEAGSYSVLRGTIESVNTVYAEMAKQVDLCDISGIAEGLGMHSADGSEIQDQNPSFILGSSADTVAPLTMAAAYAGIANKGVYCAPRAVVKVVDPNGEELAGQPENCRKALEPEVAAAGIYAMKQAMAGYGANPWDGVPIFGKTGTTDDAIQTWVMGATTKAATATWVGNISGKQNLRQIYLPTNRAAELRHSIARPILAAVNAKLGGGELPAVEPKFMTGSNAPRVPSGIIGTSLQGAEAALRALGLGFANGGPVDSDRPVGEVVSSSPAPGSRVARGTIVTVYTSNGTDVGAAVPDVVGRNFDEATAILNAAGFSNINGVCVSAGNDDDDEGHDNGNGGPFNIVVEQSPGGGSQARPSDTVELRVLRETC
jgi:membrane peptidoglycan carboxypeptidase